MKKYNALAAEPGSCCLRDIRLHHPDSVIRYHKNCLSGF
jgi:hypothetical protein